MLHYLIGLSREDRTPDLLLPKQAHYQAVLYSDKTGAGYQNRTDNRSLEGSRFTIKLIPHLVPLDGIEPTIDVYKATVIPFN